MDDKIDAQVKCVMTELSKLHQIVNSGSKQISVKFRDLEIPYNTFLYKIEWLKEQLQTDYGYWIADSKKIQIDIERNHIH